jgi:RNA polymerase sigma-70 factor (ECF subfamily)
MRRLETLLEIASALEQLPETQREAVRMRYIEGLPLAEISQRLDRTTTAVAGLLKRGLENLRGQFDPT